MATKLKEVDVVIAGLGWTPLLITLAGIPGATAGAVLYAVEQGWVKLEGAH